MFVTTPTHIRLAQGIAVVAAAAALLAPTASATRLITDTLAPGGTSASSPRFITDTLAPGGTSASSPRFITDTLAPGGSSVPPAGYRFITDTLAPGGGASGVVSVPAANGFNWTDAGIGAVLACGLMLLTLAAHQLVGRRRRGQLAF